MNWSEFASSSGGFSRTDPHLAVSLTFAEPLSESITSWPQERDALQRKLHKSQKDAIPFHYDTSIRLGLEVQSEYGETRDDKGRVWIEEAFMDCWADLMNGAGWIERDELTFKEANWALASSLAHRVVCELTGRLNIKPSLVEAMVRLRTHSPIHEPVISVSFSKRPSLW
jgi:hypothetical protein